MWIFLGILGVLVLLWLGLSIKIVGPTERGIPVILGSSRRVRESGKWVLIPFLFPITELVRYPTKQYRLDYPHRPVITTRGEYPKGNGEFHEAAEITVDTTLYFRWPKGDDLIKAFQTAPPPGLAQVISDFFEDAVVGITRAVCGSKTWREVIGDREGVKREILKRLKEDSPFHTAGINDIQVVIEEIKLPDSLRALIIRPEEADLERKGVEQEARGYKAKIRRTGEAYQNLGFFGRLFAPFFTLLDRRR